MSLNSLHWSDNRVLTQMGASTITDDGNVCRKEASGPSSTRASGSERVRTQFQEFLLAFSATKSSALLFLLALEKVSLLIPYKNYK